MSNEKKFLSDTYNIYKEDPSKFRALFTRRMSGVEEKIRRKFMKDRIKQVRKELRIRLQN